MSRASRVPRTLLGSMTRRVLASLFALAAASPAAAQTAELTGTYVRYVAVSQNGVMVASDAPDGRACMPSCHCDPTSTSCVEGRGMRYSEEGSASAVTCDAFYPRNLETFTVQAVRVDGSNLVVHNSFDSGALGPSEGPAVADRVIHWAGTFMDHTGGGSLRIDQDWSYAPDDRVVRLTVTLTNLGPAPLSEVHYLRNADPNFVGLCPASGTGSAATANDVLRQPPTEGDALATASAGGFVLGIGAHDARARASTGGRENTDAAGEWIRPRDAEGALENVSVDVVFREPELAPGDATTFELLYVWGTTVAEVEARFDGTGAGGSTCAGVADGVGCSSSSGAAGVCHAFSCCTGCWDAAAGRCEGGATAEHCGLAGAACTSCDDHLDCTSDVCGLGVCTNPPAPVATPCEDGAFCTVGDVCDGHSRCVAGAGNECDDHAACTSDACDESADACLHVLGSGCLVGGDCVASGARPLAYPCLVCDPTQSASDWSPAPVASACSDARCSAGVTFSEGTCDAAGACVRATVMACASGACLHDGSACEPPCTASSCPPGERCGEAMHCVSLATDGSTCAADDECSSGHCADGVCCADACTGLCAACDLPHEEGRCVAIPATTDPARECPGSAVCDGHGACATPGVPDAGTTDASRLDAATTPPAPRSSCRCAAAGAAEGGPALALLGLFALGALVVARRRRAAIALVIAVLLAPSVALATVLTGSLGFRWDVDDAVGGHGEIANGTSDAYDACYVLAVASTQYTLPIGGTPSLSAAGRQVDLPPVALGTDGLTAERHVYVTPTGDWARFIEVIANPTASSISASVAISGNLGSDSATTLVATSSGDAVLTTADTWFTTDDTDLAGDPSLAHVLRGAGAAVDAAAVTLSGDQISYVYGVTVPAHGRVAIMHFAVQASSRALAEAGARAVSMLGDDTRIGAEPWAAAIVNWSTGWMDPCAGRPDLATCSSWSGPTGVCHGGACCTGCWDGSACQTGSDVAACGRQGAACAECRDAESCTDDSCGGGVCMHVPTPSSSRCDDGAFCTAGDHCDGAGRCRAGATSPCDDGVSCTIDDCDETARACSNVFSTGCTIGGECVGVGEHHVAYPCLVCDPTRDASDWSTEPAGTTCGATRCSAGHVFAAGTCDAAGACDAPRPTTCASSSCDPDGVRCEPVCTATSCPAGQRCGAELHCISVLALGSACTSDEECVSDACADGVCCDRACDGTCEACDLSGRTGTCRTISAGMDPAGECGPMRSCDGRGGCAGRGGDAGRADAASAGGDAGMAADSGAPAPRAAACSCRAQGRRGDGWASLALGLAVLVVSRRRPAW